MSENHWKILKGSLEQLEIIAENTEPVATSDVNIVQLGGASIALNAGAASAGTIRCTLANNDALTTDLRTAALASQSELENISNQTDAMVIDINNIDSTFTGLSTAIQNTSDKLDSLNSLNVAVGLQNAFKIAPIDENGNPTYLTCHAGNIGDGTLRICIASNDALILNISNKLDSIYNILNDVWNDGTNKLRVDTA